MPLTMKAVDDKTKRDIIFGALFKNDGNREAAARELGVSTRTFYRYLRDLDMYPQLDKLGWNKNPGPPRGKRGDSVVRTRIRAHIAKHRGQIDYGALAMELWHEDSRVTRQRIYSALEDMKTRGQLTVDDLGVWSLVGVGAGVGAR